jgi:hypothetical protein
MALARAKYCSCWQVIPFNVILRICICNTTIMAMASHSLLLLASAATEIGCQKDRAAEVRFYNATIDKECSNLVWTRGVSTGCFDVLKCR